jgi:hypothetical protein
MCLYNIGESSTSMHRAYLLCNLVFSGDHDRDFKVNDVIRWLAEYDVVIAVV